jgi:hypothetical protein
MMREGSRIRTSVVASQSFVWCEVIVIHETSAGKGPERSGRRGARRRAIRGIGGGG